MSNYKSPTELAMEKQRKAYEERRDKPGAPLAPMFERQAAELLALTNPPDVGPGGEVVREQTHGLPGKREVIRDTLGKGADRIAEDASIRRTDLLLQPSFHLWQWRLMRQTASAPETVSKRCSRINWRWRTKQLCDWPTRR